MNDDHIERSKNICKEAKLWFSTGLHNRTVGSMELWLYGPPELLAQREFAALCPVLAINISYLLACPTSWQRRQRRRISMAHGYPWLPLAMALALALFWVCSLGADLGSPSTRCLHIEEAFAQWPPSKFIARKLILVNIWLRWPQVSESVLWVSEPISTSNRCPEESQGNPIAIFPYTCYSPTNMLLATYNMILFPWILVFPFTFKVSTI